MQHREEILNAKGLRPIIIELFNGKFVDWNLFSRPQKQGLKKSIKKTKPKLWAKIENSKKIKIYDKALKENVYLCSQCNKVHVAHEIDEGAAPVFIQCHHCKWPQVPSRAYDIPDSYKDKAPNIIFRFSTKEEYLNADNAMKAYLEAGGLFMETIR